MCYSVVPLYLEPGYLSVDLQNIVGFGEINDTFLCRTGMWQGSPLHVRFDDFSSNNYFVFKIRFHI